MWGLIDSFKANRVKRGYGHGSVKAEIQADIEESNKKLMVPFDNLLEKLENSKVKNADKLYAAIFDMKVAVVALDMAMREDKNLIPLVNFSVRKIGECGSVATFKEQLSECDAMEKLTFFAETMINFDNFVQLDKTLGNVAKFKKLSERRQTALINALDGELLTECLDADQVKEITGTTCTELGEALALHKSEVKDMTKMFGKLTDKHLPDLNTIQEQILAELNPYCKALHKKLKPKTESKSESKSESKIGSDSGAKAIVVSYKTSVNNANRSVNNAKRKADNDNTNQEDSRETKKRRL